MPKDSAFDAIKHTFIVEFAAVLANYRGQTNPELANCGGDLQRDFAYAGSMLLPWVVGEIRTLNRERGFEETDGRAFMRLAKHIVDNARDIYRTTAEGPFIGQRLDLVIIQAKDEVILPALRSEKNVMPPEVYDKLLQDEARLQEVSDFIDSTLSYLEGEASAPTSTPASRKGKPGRPKLGVIEGGKKDEPPKPAEPPKP